MVLMHSLVVTVSVNGVTRVSNITVMITEVLLKINAPVSTLITTNNIIQK